MKTLSIKTLKYKIFGKEIYVLLKDEDIEPFNIFTNILNDGGTLSDAKLSMVKSYIKNNNHFFKVTSENCDHFTKNFMLINDVIQVVSDNYLMESRDRKITEIIGNI